MRADLDTLLPDAARAPDAPLDADALWARGRRRRAIRQVSAAGGSLAGIAALALVATSFVGGTGTAVPEISPMAPPAGTGQEATDDGAGEGDVSGPDVNDDTDEAGDPDAAGDRDAASTRRDELAAEEEQRLIESGERSPTDASDATDGGASTSSTSPDAPSSPTPDWSRANDPCAVHDPADVGAFIDVVSPVNGQQIDTGAVALVGCASVHEGTVRYRISQDGTVVEDGFVTATAGGPELGEFRQGITLRTSGTHTLEVFWDSPADDEGERDKRTYTFEVG